MADGTAAGLVSAQQLAQDAARMRAEAEKRRCALHLSAQTTGDRHLHDAQFVRQFSMPCITRAMVHLKLRSLTCPAVRVCPWSMSRLSRALLLYLVCVVFLARCRQTAVGRDAETVYRDRATGRIVSQEEFQDQTNKHKKKVSDP